MIPVPVFPAALALLPALLAGCSSQYGYSSLTRVDTFQQVRRNTVDILLVVDDSCSMAEEQDKLAANFDAFIAAFEGVDVDWRIGLTTTDLADQDSAGHLRGGEDEVELATAEGQVLDRVAWDRSWPVAPGVALQLDPAQATATGNDAAAAWCGATTAWAGGDLGSPGAPNPSCEDGAVAKPAGGGSESEGSGAGHEERAPVPGDLVISELLIDPQASADALGEWVELTNLTDDILDLGGAVLRDDGRNLATLPEGTKLWPATYGAMVVGRSGDTAQNGGVEVDLVVADGLSLNDPVTVLTPDLPDAAELFAEMVAVGTGGAGFEMGLEAARLALSEPLISTDNAGFLRQDARLALIFLSDEDDYSPLPPDEYLLSWGQDKGDAAWRTDGLLTVSAVAGIHPPPYDGALSCESEDGAAEYGARYVDLAARTGGTAQSICDDDFSTLATELGLVASGLELELALSEPASPESLVVRVYDTQDEESLLYEAVQDVDYSYVLERNAIRFGADHAPPSESWISVAYQVLAEGQAP